MSTVPEEGSFVLTPGGRTSGACSRAAGTAPRALIRDQRARKHGDKKLKVLRNQKNVQAVNGDGG
jgi:hypothetical protein